MIANEHHEQIKSRLRTSQAQTGEALIRVLNAISDLYSLSIGKPRGDNKLVCHLKVLDATSNDRILLEINHQQVHLRFRRPEILDSALNKRAKGGPGSNDGWTYFTIPRHEVPSGGKAQYISIEEAVAWSRDYAYRINPALRSKADAYSEATFTPSKHIDDSGTQSRESTGQGYEIDPERKLAVEERAMKVAMDYYRDDNPDDRSKFGSYDILIARNGIEYFVEVKGSTNSCNEIFLTANEVEHTKRNTGKCRLLTVSNIQYTKGRSAFGGDPREIYPFEIDDTRLRPTQFRYTV